MTSTSKEARERQAAYQRRVVEALSSTTYALTRDEIKARVFDGRKHVSGAAVHAALRKLLADGRVIVAARCVGSGLKVRLIDVYSLPPLAPST